MTDFDTEPVIEYVAVVHPDSVPHGMVLPRWVIVMDELQPFTAAEEREGL